MDKKYEEIYFWVLETCDRMMRTANADNDSEEELDDKKLEFEELIGEDAVIKFDEYMDSAYEHEADKDFLRVQLAYLRGVSDAKKSISKEVENKIRKEIEEKLRKEFEGKR